MKMGSVKSKAHKKEISKDINSMDTDSFETGIEKQKKILVDESCFDNVCIYCDLCFLEGGFMEAVRFCTNCNKYLCNECYTTHGKDKTNERWVPISTEIEKHGEFHPVYTKVSAVNGNGLSKGQNEQQGQTTLKCVGKIIADCYYDRNDCWISGIAILPSGDLVVTDGGNSVVKMIDAKTGELVSEVELRSEPFDVTVMSKYEIAVTLPESQKVQLFTNELYKSRQIKVDGHCYGICHKNGNTVISFLCPEKVEVIDNQGKILVRIALDCNEKNIFSAPYYVQFSANGRSIYVSDFLKDAVFKFSIGGKLLAKYSNSDLRRPEAISIVDNDTVVVVSRDNNSLHFLSRDCLQKNILEDRTGPLINPWSLCYCERTKFLYVGNKEGKHINVYELLNF